MVVSSFKTNPYASQELLKKCESGLLQLPDFQRSWVWDEDRIKSLANAVAIRPYDGARMTSADAHSQTTSRVG
jgi:hypothetical protein